MCEISHKKTGDMQHVACNLINDLIIYKDLHSSNVLGLKNLSLSIPNPI